MASWGAFLLTLTSLGTSTDLGAYMAAEGSPQAQNEKLEKPLASQTITVDYLDVEGRIGELWLEWNQTFEGFSITARESPQRETVLLLRYEKKKSHRLLQKGYTLWLAPHHLSDLVAQTPLKLIDFEQLDRWIRGEEDRRQTPWTTVKRGETWWRATAVDRLVESSDGANARSTVPLPLGDR